MLLHVLYLIGITAEAMTGALAAGRRRMDTFGVIIIATATALGGGSVRDILLGHYPLGWVKHPEYVIIVAIAAVLTMNPAVWTLDEPLAALDEAGAAWLTDFLRALKRAGKTILFSTHDTALADALADARWCFTPAREVRVER